MLGKRISAVLGASVAAVCVGAAPASAADPTVSVTLPCVNLVVVQVNCTPAQPSPPKPACTDSDLEPSSSNLAAIRSATLCLLNKERSRHHLAKLHSNATLRGAAASYANVLVRKQFFDHTAPDGTTMLDRILRTSYIKIQPREWWVGENLAWGSQNYDTPAKIVDAWMHSPGHRKNILTSRYRDIGLGVTNATPGKGPGSTYVTDFGRRIR